MKRLIIFLLLFAAIKVAGQTTGYLRFDTVLIYKQGGTAELVLMNKTKDSLGILTNYGNGRTRFMKSRAINDSTIVVGLDTMTVHAGSGASKWEYDGSNNLVNKSFPGVKIEINKRLSILDSGYVASGPLSGTNPGEGTGYKNFWYQGKAAYRSGFTDASAFNDAFIGQYSTSFGYNATASGIASFSAGIGTLASGQGSIALGGSGTQATGNNSIAGGLGSVASGANSMSFGNSANAAGQNSFAAGFNPAANGSGSAAFNQTTRAEGDYSAAFGEGSEARTRWGFVAGLFNQTNYSLLIPQFSIGKYNDTTNKAEVFRIGGGTAGTNRVNIFAIDSNGHLIVNPPLDGDSEVDSVLVWDNSDKKIKKVAPGTGGGGGAITTIIDSPLYVKAGDSALSIPDTLSIYQVTSIRDGYLKAADKKSYDSAYRSLMNAFGGDTSVIIFGFILRPTIDGSGNVTWDLIDDTDHDPLNMSPTVTANSSAITVNWPTSTKIVTLVGNVDEALRAYGVQFGHSVGVSTATIQLTLINNWGGYIHASGGAYSSTGNYNNNNPTLTYNSSTGQISLAVTGIETGPGGVLDHYKIGTAAMKPGWNPLYDITGSTGTSLKFYMTDVLGNVITGPPTDGAGFWWRGPTWWRSLNPVTMGGSLAWLQNIFISSSNIWFLGVRKR